MSNTRFNTTVKHDPARSGAKPWEVARFLRNRAKVETVIQNCTHAIVLDCEGNPVGEMKRKVS